MCTTAVGRTSPPTIAFDAVPDALKLPKNLPPGEVSGVAVDSKEHPQ